MSLNLNFQNEMVPLIGIIEFQIEICLWLIVPDIQMRVRVIVHPLNSSYQSVYDLTAVANRWLWQKRPDLVGSDVKNTHFWSLEGVHMVFIWLITMVKYFQPILPVG